MADLILHELTPSPNNVKVRVALGYKGLDYTRKPLTFTSYPGDRSGIVELSRQPRLPVLQHGDVKLFDSGAILRYLEANFPQTKPIFVTDHTQFSEIETWEFYSKAKIGPALGMLFGQAFAPEVDPAVIERGNALLHENTAELEAALATKPWLVGDHLTAADIVVASPFYLAQLEEQHLALSPLVGFFKQHLRLEGRPHVHAWARKVLAYDAVLAQPAGVA
ncbi:MAG: glutathione S-transferase family protein [Planctomycetota bacterium]